MACLKLSRPAASPAAVTGAPGIVDRRVLPVLGKRLLRRRPFVGTKTGGPGLI